MLDINRIRISKKADSAMIYLNPLHGRLNDDIITVWIGSTLAAFATSRTPFWFPTIF